MKPRIVEQNFLSWDKNLSMYGSIVKEFGSALSYFSIVVSYILYFL